MKTLFEIYDNDCVTFEESSYIDGVGNEWTAPYLYEQVKAQKLKLEKINLRHIDLCSMPWSNGSITSIDSLMHHLIRVENADLKYPIIMCWDGFIMEGWHRIVQAILEKRTHMNAYRFEKWTKPDKPKVEQ